MLKSILLILAFLTIMSGTAEAKHFAKQMERGDTVSDIVWKETGHASWWREPFVHIMDKDKENEYDKTDWQMRRLPVGTWVEISEPVLGQISDPIPMILEQEEDKIVSSKQTRPDSTIQPNASKLTPTLISPAISVANLTNIPPINTEESKEVKSAFSTESSVNTENRIIVIWALLIGIPLLIFTTYKAIQHHGLRLL